MQYKLWIDDIRPAPEDYSWFQDIDRAIRFIDDNKNYIILIDLDHDAGKYRRYDKEDYVVILDELERFSVKDECWKQLLSDQIKFRLHSMNPVGVQNMRAIIKRNCWREIY